LRTNSFTKLKKMKSNIKFLALLMTSFLVFSCSSDDEAEVISGNGDIELFFDNAVNGDALILGNSYTNSNGETLKINRFNYIVSNFVLVKEDNTEVVYPKNDSYFIISHEANLNEIVLENIPAGNYKAIKFGIGIDQERFNAGQAAQQAFWDQAAAHFLTWSWSVGYKNINFEGTFTSPTVDGERDFKVHMGSHGTVLDNYREVSINFPSVARVRTTETPSVHFIADANSILDGASKLKLGDAINNAGWAQIMVNAEKAPIIANNAQAGMFEVDHVHNGATEH
jgi:hypothetical protein